MRFRARLTPRGGIDRIEGASPAGELRVRVRAAPVEGAANEALLRVLGDELGVGRTAVSLERGATARQKLVRVDGLEPDELLAHWPGLVLEKR